MARKDEYYNRAKQEGYRSRASYKLLQIDEREHIFSSGDIVVDLGAAPGGWLQVAANEVGENGRVIGVDFQRIKSLDDVPAAVSLIRGDMTDPATRTEIQEATTHGRVDVIISDMAPEMTGEYSLDHARSIHLAEQALATARELLSPGGHLVVKVFDGPDLQQFRKQMESSFDFVKAFTPDASRDQSSERYLIGKRYIQTEIEEGEQIRVEITDIGSEGDGIADIDGYRLFVPETTPGDEVTVEIEALKATFGFARCLDRESEDQDNRP